MALRRVWAEGRDDLLKASGGPLLTACFNLWRFNFSCFNLWLFQLIHSTVIQNSTVTVPFPKDLIIPNKLNGIRRVHQWVQTIEFTIVDDIPSLVLTRGRMMRSKTKHTEKSLQ